MKKVLLVTLYDNMNLGNRLQHYALQTVLQGMGCEVFNLIQPKKTSKDSLFSIGKYDIKIILAKLGFSRFYNSIIIEKEIKKRTENIKTFSDVFLDNKIYVTTKFLREFDSNTFDYAISGSDQVWHNWKEMKNELEYFYLSFISPEKRIAYAPSFGFSGFPDEDILTHKKGLLELYGCSCREEEGAALIKELIGREVEIVPDPTILLEKNQWRKVAKQPIYEVPKHFMLVYFLGKKTEEYQAKIKQISKEKNLQLIDIFDVGFSEYFQTDPAEFIYLVDRADYVCTDSFHATVFSIIFNKNFTVFKRYQIGFMNMFGRIEGLLKNAGLLEHNNSTEDYFITKEIENWQLVDAAINLYRQTGINFLRKYLMSEELENENK